MKLTHEIMYQAILNKDSAFEGIFYTGVKTTGIFCRPTCTARKPKSENVEFFNSTRLAIVGGYRPCKICKPLEKAGQTPADIIGVLNEIDSSPGLKLKDYDLIKRGIQPEYIRRWFKKNHGITFHAYQRMLRINSAFNAIKNGNSVSDTAFDSGYESLSAFADSFKSTVGTAPSYSRTKNLINITKFESPLGPMFSCASENGICLLEFTDRRMLETELKALSKHFKANIVYGKNKYFDILKMQINEYFYEGRKSFNIDMETPGTEFQKKVWTELQNIPYGKTRSYKEQSIALKNPGAVRAVANANGMNRIAIIIPCHRVIGEDGHLTGYGGGLWRKKWLLDHEAGDAKEMDSKGQQRIVFGD